MSLFLLHHLVSPLSLPCIWCCVLSVSSETMSGSRRFCRLVKTRLHWASISGCCAWLGHRDCFIFQPSCMSSSHTLHKVTSSRGCLGKKHITVCLGVMSPFLVLIEWLVSREQISTVSINTNKEIRGLSTLNEFDGPSLSLVYSSSPSLDLQAKRFETTTDAPTNSSYGNGNVRK